MNRRRFDHQDGLTTGTVFRNAREWLDENHEAGPFLLWLEAFDPHEPWDLPRHYADRYCSDFEGTEFILPPEAAQGTKQEQDRTRALYFGEVSYVDKCVGDVIDKLASLGRLQDTAVVLASDHGTELMDHDRFGKSAPALHPYNTQLNWMVRHPELPGGSTVNDHVGNHDLFPTILDMLGIAQPERAEDDLQYAGRKPTTAPNPPDLCGRQDSCELLAAQAERGYRVRDLAARIRLGHRSLALRPQRLQALTNSEAGCLVRAVRDSGTSTRPESAPRPQ